MAGTAKVLPPQDFIKDFVDTSTFHLDRIIRANKARYNKIASHPLFTYPGAQAKLPRQLCQDNLTPRSFRRE